MVPRDAPSSKEVEQVLEELAARGPISRKRTKDWGGGNTNGKEVGWMQQTTYRQQMPNPAPTAPQQHSNQRKASVVRPSPVDSHPAYTQDWTEIEPAVSAGGRRKRRAAAGVAAATAAVLRDPALEEIEKADLRRASSREYAERRWGTIGGSHSGEPRSDSGGSSGGGGALWRHHDRSGAPPPGPPLMDNNASSQQELTHALNSLTHLLSIAVQQGKLGGGSGGGGGVAPKAASMGWGAMETQHAQQRAAQSQQLPSVGGSMPQLQQLLQQLQQQQQPPPQHQQQRQQQQQYQPRGQTYDYQHQTGQYGGSTRDTSMVGNFGGQRIAPSVPAPPVAVQPSLNVVGTGAGGSRNHNNNNTGSPDESMLRESILNKLLAAVAQEGRSGGSTAQQQQVASQPQAEIHHPRGGSNDSVQNTAAVLVERAIAARVAQAQAHAAFMQQGSGMGTIGNRQPSTLQEALAQHAQQNTVATAQVAKPKPIPAAQNSRQIPTSIPGSTYPIDSLLSHLLQQQAEAQKKASDGQP